MGNEAEDKSLSSDPTDPFKGENGELENTLYMCDLRQRHQSQLRMRSHYPENTVLVRVREHHDLPIRREGGGSSSVPESLFSLTQLPHPLHFF